MCEFDTRFTTRLRLQRPTPADEPDYFRMYQDARVTATLGGKRSLEEIQRLIERLHQHWQEHGYGLWIARDRATGAYVGRGGLRHLVLEGKEEMEVGYGLMPEYWGRGLATELAQECVRVAFEELNRRDLVCFTLPTNRASRRVMEKVGFRYERDGAYFDLPHRFYRLTAAEWRASRQLGDSPCDSAMRRVT